MVRLQAVAPWALVCYQHGMTSSVAAPKPRAVEFFAGVGLVRMGLEEAGAEVVFANDISPTKARMYESNFGNADFVLGDITELKGTDIPDAEIATASFPCTDLSLAGNRAGLNGRESGLVGDLLRILKEMEENRPTAVMLENVAGFATSNGGRDLLKTLEEMNELGYYCDVVSLDARHFVPQSRPRLFVIGTIDPPSVSNAPDEWVSLRPKWVPRFLTENPNLRTFSFPLPPLPPGSEQTLDDVAEPVPPTDPTWWDDQRTLRFLSSLSPINEARATALRHSPNLSRRSAYRRTRGGKAVWEIRGDGISGCLRTTRGGSSKQALVEGGNGDLRVRWMTALEYARLQGAPTFRWGAMPETQVRFALGDAVCVPAVAWLARNFLLPLVTGKLAIDEDALSEHRELAYAE